MADFLFLYLVYLNGIVELIVNDISVAVIKKVGLGHISCNHLRNMTVVDNMVVIFCHYVSNTFVWLLGDRYPSLKNPNVNKLFWTISLFNCVCSSYKVAYMSAEKVVVVSFPLQFSNNVTTRRRWFAFMSTYSFWLPGVLFMSTETLLQTLMTHLPSVVSMSWTQH